MNEKKEDKSREKKRKKRDYPTLFNLREKEAKRCPDCGAKVVLWPCLACNPNVGCY